MKKIFIVTILYMSSLLSTNIDYKNALIKAKDEHKIIMIMLEKENCHFCKKMEDEVFTDKNVSTILDRDFILVKLDVNRDELPLGLEKGMTPTFAFVKENGVIFYLIRGAWKRDDFISLLKYVKRKSKLKREIKK